MIVRDTSFADNSVFGGGSDDQGGTLNGEFGKGLGAAIFNLNGQVTLLDSSFSGNVSADGSALYNLGHGAEADSAALSVASIDIDSASIAPLLTASALTDHGLSDGVAWTLTRDVIYAKPGNLRKIQFRELAANDLSSLGAPPLWTISEVGAPDSGQAATFFLGTRRIVYDPQSAIAGGDRFTYTVSDGNGHSAEGVVRLLSKSDRGHSENLARLIQLPDGRVQIRFRGIPGRLYQLQFTSSAGDLENWQDLVAVAADEKGLFIFEYDPAVLGSGGFFRSR
jgi:hypothetical protein